MKHSIKKTLKFICIGGFALANLCLCCISGSKDDTPFDQKLVSYLKKDLLVVNVSSEKYTAYFDFTRAMTANGKCSIYYEATNKATNHLCKFTCGTLCASILLCVQSGLNVGTFIYSSN